MFKPGKNHQQKTIFDQDMSYPDHMLEKLQQSWAEDFYKHIFLKINEERFAVLYSDEPSRPNKSVNTVISLLILKEMNDLTDEECIESLYFDYRFHHALGINDISKEGISLNTIGNFRRRLIMHETEHKQDLFGEEIEALTEHLAEYMQLNKSMARMDFFMLSSHCKQMTRLELVYVVVRNMVRELDKMKDRTVPKDFRVFLEKQHQNKTLYHTRHADAQSKLEILLDKAYELYQHVCHDEPCRQTQAYEHLRRLLNEQCVELENGSIIPLEGKELKSGILQNPSDPDATYRNKSGQNHTGYSVNLLDVRDKDKGVSLVMHHDVQPNTHHDTTYGQTFVSEHPLADELKTLAVDGGYYQQETIQKAHEKGIDINFSQMTGHKVDRDQIGVDQFKMDDHLITHCPAGHEVTSAKYDHEKQVYTAKMEKSFCQNCPLQDQCPIQQQKKFNTIRFTEKKRQTDIMRSRMGTERHRKLSNFRAGVEGIPSALRRGYGMDQIPASGHLRTKIWVRAKLMAYNFRSCLKYWFKQAKTA